MPTLVRNSVTSSRANNPSSAARMRNVLDEASAFGWRSSAICSVRTGKRMESATNGPAPNAHPPTTHRRRVCVVPERGKTP
jgi:hypothetical protein